MVLDPGFPVCSSLYGCSFSHRHRVGLRFCFTFTHFHLATSHTVATWELGVQVPVTANRKLWAMIPLHVWQLLVPPESLWSTQWTSCCCFRSLTWHRAGHVCTEHGAADCPVSLNTQLMIRCLQCRPRHLDKRALRCSHTCCFSLIRPTQPKSNCPPFINNGLQRDGLLLGGSRTLNTRQEWWMNRLHFSPNEQLLSH